MGEIYLLELDIISVAWKLGKMKDQIKEENYITKRLVNQDLVRLQWVINLYNEQVDKLKNKKILIENDVNFGIQILLKNRMMLTF